MSAQVVALDAGRPHLTLDCTGQSGTVHVYPVRYFLDFIAGKAVEPLAEDVARHIVLEWLCCMRAGCMQHAIAEARE